MLFVQFYFMLSNRYMRDNQFNVTLSKIFVSEYSLAWDFNPLHGS